MEGGRKGEGRDERIYLVHIKGVSNRINRVCVCAFFCACVYVHLPHGFSQHFRKGQSVR